MLDNASPTSTQYCTFAKKICTDNGQYHCIVFFLRSPNLTLRNIASEICGDAIQLMSIDGLLQVLKFTDKKLNRNSYYYSFPQEQMVEKHWRDVRVHQILEGTNEIMRHIIGRAIVS